MTITLDTVLGTFSYVFALLTGMLTASGKTARKQFFLLRLIPCSLAAFTLRVILSSTLLLLPFPNNTLMRFTFAFINLSTSVLLGCSLHFCFEDCGLWKSFFHFTIGCSLQYLTYKLYWLLSLFHTFSKVGETVVVLAITSVCYQIAWRLYFHRLDSGDALKTRRIQNILAMVLAVILIYSDSFLRLGALEFNSLWVDMVVWGLCVLMMTVIMLLELSILLFFQMRDERDLLRWMMEQQREQYRIEQRNIQLINIKYHDLRHMLRTRGAELMDETLLNELTDHINLYDAQLNTGNDALTVVLDKYSMYCKEHGIRITCMIDGALLSFIPAYKLYAMFGNAVENAVKAVRHLSREKRVISLSQQTNGNLLNIRITNYFDGQVTYEHGLPVNREVNHGFGVKSIQLIAEEFGGSIHVQNTDDLFILNILLPLPQQLASGAT